MKYNTAAEYSEKIKKLIIMMSPFLKRIKDRLNKIFLLKSYHIFETIFLQQFEPILLQEKIKNFHSSIIEKFERKIYLLIFQEIFSKRIFQFLEINKSFLFLIDNIDVPLVENSLNFIEIIGITTDTMNKNENYLKIFPSKEEVEKILNFDIFNIETGFGIKNILVIYFLFCYLENIYAKKSQKLNDFHKKNPLYDINFLFSLQIQYNFHLFLIKISDKKQDYKFEEKLIEKLRNLFLKFFPSLINPSFELTVSIKILQKKMAKIILFLKEEGYKTFNITDFDQTLILR